MTRLFPRHWRGLPAFKIRQRRKYRAQRLGHSFPSDWLLMRDHYRRCLKCGATDGLERDHIVALCLEGSSEHITNLQVLCHDCNLHKGIHDQTNYKLLHADTRRMWVTRRDWPVIQSLRENAEIAQMGGLAKAAARKERAS